MKRGRADMWLRTGLLTAALLSAPALDAVLSPAAAKDPATQGNTQVQSSGAAQMVQDLGAQTASALSSEEAEKPGQRRALLRDLVRQGFDLELTSQFVLGKHWHGASDTQRTQFTDLFTEYLLNSYARHLASFRADTLRVVGSNPAGDADILVETSVEGADGPASPVWRVRSVEGRYKIIDVTVDGVSLALTQRREFASVVNRVGIDGLIKMLREKLAAQAQLTDAQIRQATHASFLASLLASPNANRLDLFVAGGR
jgi:phospholipid transport system substrate-binding protein